MQISDLNNICSFHFLQILVNRKFFFNGFRMCLDKIVTIIKSESLAGERMRLHVNLKVYAIYRGYFEVVKLYKVIYI